MLPNRTLLALALCAALAYAGHAALTHAAVALQAHHATLAKV